MRLGVLAICCLALCGCSEQMMARQPAPRPLQPSPFFPDNMSARPMVQGTVPHGFSQKDKQVPAKEKNKTFPFPITEKVLYRGKVQFEINCAMCHGYAGYADGMVVQRGFTKPPSYHIARLREAPVEHFYNVITKGIGAMPAHDYLVTREDRWAIVAYIRALQLSQNATLEDVPEAEKQKLQDRGGAAK